MPSSYILHYLLGFIEYGITLLYIVGCRPIRRFSPAVFVLLCLKWIVQMSSSILAISELDVDVIGKETAEVGGVEL